MSISAVGAVPVTRSYGAGSLGSGLPVPPGAVPANPGNLASLINSNPAGTDFDLAPGIYNLDSQGSKIGNGYYGDPNDHTAVVFDGGVTYNTTAPGGVPTGGFFYMLQLEDNNTVANVTVQKYRGNNDNSSASPLRQSSSFNCLLQNLLIQDNYRSGHQLGGGNNQYRFITNRYNGSYCWTGSFASDDSVYNCDSYSSGDENMETRGLTPKLDNSNRGISKFNHSDRIEFFDSWFHDIKGFSNGLWWDGNNTEGNVFNCLFERFDRFGLEHELTHGGTIKGCVFRAAGKIEDPTFNYRHSAIGIATGGVMLIEDNEIDGQGETWVGVQMYQNNRDASADPTFWTAMCGSVIQRNTIFDINGYFISSHCNYTKDGCNFSSVSGDPSTITIQNNDYIGGNNFWEKGVRTPAEWAAYGYS